MDKDATVDVDELNDDDFAKLKGEMTTGEPDKPADKEPQPAKTEADAAKVEDTADDEDEPAGKSETVPHGRYHHERERRKAAEAEKEKLAQNYQKLLERTQQLMEARATPAGDELAKDTDEPDPANPLEQIAWVVKELRAGKERQQQTEVQSREAGERQQFAQGIKAIEDDFKKVTPDYDAALSFAAQSRDEELQLMYPLSTSEERRQFILNEWNQITRQSIQAGVNPAERVYQFAQKRGYKKAEPQIETKAEDPVTKIASQEETRKASLSLGKTGGGIVNTDKIDPAGLLDMSDEEFEAYKKKFGSVSRAFAA